MFPRCTITTPLSTKLILYLPLRGFEELAPDVLRVSPETCVWLLYPGLYVFLSEDNRIGVVTGEGEGNIQEVDPSSLVPDWQNMEVSEFLKRLMSNVLN